MRGRFAPFVIGSGLLALGAVTPLFAVYAWWLREPSGGFLAASALSLAFGWTLRRLGNPASEPSRREALLAVLLLWVVLPLLGGIPFFHSPAYSPLNSVFEAVSGFTATGATTLRDFGSLPVSMFLYRSFSQWVGGIGIILIFLAVFPQLAIAGRQLFAAEMPGIGEERLTPRLRSTAGRLLALYLALTAACAAGYVYGGMTPVGALAHAFSTVSAGGFSTDAESFGGSTGAVIDWVAVLFMFLSGVSFALQFRAWSGRPRLFLRDPELRAYTAIFLLAGAALTLLLLDSYELADALRHGFFQSISVLTTTGYASADFNGWSERSQSILVGLMLVGGSAGSAAGGIKVIRWLLLIRHSAREVRRALHPRGVFPVRLGNRAVPEEVMRSVAAFITLYVILVLFGAMVLIAFGSDFTTALTASLAATGNVGPGLGGVGPLLDYAGLHPVSRLVLIFQMLAGRLEVVTVFVLFTPDWWRLPRRNLLRRPR